MIDIALQAVPNQAFSVVLEDARYAVTIKEANGVMVADITRDNVVLIQGTRITAGTPLLPYRYLESGNFVLLTQDDALPYYTEFGTTQSLVYVTKAEIASLREG
jgi:hypothetical protein